MSAVYHHQDFDILITENLTTVLKYVAENPGKPLETIATAVSLPYEVVFAIAQRANLVVMPNASGEIHWHAHKP